MAADAKLTELLTQTDASERFDETVRTYEERFANHDKATTVRDRMTESAMLTKDYYRLATNFYLNAWGRMFHFGIARKGESFKESLLNHEYMLSDKLGLQPGETCIDAGCGVGGPAMNIARRTGAHITGINISDYEVIKARSFAEKDGLADKCTFVECDWQSIPLEDESFDKGYQIEAICHAGEHRLEVLQELHRVLKPKALFGGYEWLMTDRFDSSNPHHRHIKREIETCNGISSMKSHQDVVEAFEGASFEILESFDRALEADPERPWYQPLKGEGFNLTQLRKHPVTRFMVRGLIRGLTKAKVLPEGTLEVSKFLNRAGVALVEAGELGIFTPMHFYLARKR